MLDWIVPQTVDKISSRYNGEIKVTKSRGKFSVWVGGFEQSGGEYVEKIWSDTLNNLVIQQCSSVLILGLGCGTVVPIILNKWPKAKITGVEIDPVMIKLGKKYFGLSKYRNLKIIQGDARKYRPKQKFDLVLVDIYIANEASFITRKVKNLGKFVLINELQSTKNYFLFFKDGRRSLKL